jgi:RNA-directed DNA polymerase
MMSNSISILGPGLRAADLTFRRVLKFRDCQGPVVILDYKGRGAAVLDKTNLHNLNKRPVFWYDIADRLHPIHIFHLERSEHLRPLIRETINKIMKTRPSPISDRALDWATEVAYQLSAHGEITLGALAKSFAMPSTRRWFLDTQTDPVELSHMIDAIQWSLRYPLVYAISEGTNRCCLIENLMKPCTTWIEARAEYFERTEKGLVMSLVESALEDALRTLQRRKADPAASEMATIVHIFPSGLFDSTIPTWIEETAPWVRHIAVHSVESSRPPDALAIEWSKSARQIWILGGLRGLRKECHERWLKDEEINKLNVLEDNFMMVINAADRRYLIVRNAPCQLDVPESFRLRHHTSKSLKPTTIRQFSTAISLPEETAHYQGIFERLASVETLRLGWFRLSGCRKDLHGIDNVTVANFESNLESELNSLADELLSRSYRARPLRRVLIPKDDSGVRALGIACVRDRVVQSACLILLDQVFDQTFSHFSFGFRFRRSAHHAIALTRSYVKAGGTWAVIADIKKCFDNLDHDVLLNLVAAKVSDQAILDLLSQWLTVEVLDFSEFVPSVVGVPQGESLSPFLANVYLDPLDKHFERLGLRFVRYADDITIITEGEAASVKALKVMTDFLNSPLHLELVPAKTNYVEIKEGFGFLGFKIYKDNIEIQVQKIDRVAEAIRPFLKTLGASDSSDQKRADALSRINNLVRGFRNYFNRPGESRIADQLCYLDGRTEQMAHLYLTASIRDNPAWICRERFLSPNMDQDDDSSLANQLRFITGGYSRKGRETGSAPWRTGDEEEADGPQIKQSLTVSDPGEKAGDVRDRYRETIVEQDTRLYVLTHGSYLALDGEEIVIKKKKLELFRRRLADLDTLYLQGIAMNISVNLQLRLAELGIPVVFAPPTGAPLAVLNPVQSTRAYLRGQQILRREDPDVVTAGLKMLSVKVRNQAAVLRYFAKYRMATTPELGEALRMGAAEIAELANRISEIDAANATARTVAMGFEGRAASVYWKDVSRLVPPELPFERRVTFRASDVVNQCLNYVYGILYGEVWRVLLKVGLDPYFGIIHGSERNQGSLVFDLIEEFRAPFGDRLVFAMFGRGFRPKSGADGFLRTAFKRQLALGFEKHWSRKIAWRSNNVSPREILEKQAVNLVKLIKREGSYHPYRMHW